MEDVNSLIYQADLMRAIEESSLPDIVENLRLLAKLGPIPAEIILKLCNYLDPDRPVIKSGPKADRYNSLDFELTQDYLFLCAKENREFAWHVVNSEDEIKLPIIDLAYRNWPKQQCRYPKFPSCNDIKLLLCKIYKISERTFDTTLAKCKLAFAYDDYCKLIEIDGCGKEEAKERVCKKYKIKKVRFAASLLPQ